MRVGRKMKCIKCGKEMIISKTEAEFIKYFGYTTLKFNLMCSCGHLSYKEHHFPFNPSYRFSGLKENKHEVKEFLDEMTSKQKFKVGDKIKLIDLERLKDSYWYFTLYIKSGKPNLFTVSNILPSGLIMLKEIKEKYGLHNYDASWFIKIPRKNPSHRLGDINESEASS